MMSKKSVSFGMNHMIRSLSAVSPLTLINLTQPSRISRTETRVTQVNWWRSRVVWPAFNFHLSIVCTVSFIFDFVVEVCIRKTGTITTFRFNPHASTLGQQSLSEQKADRDNVKSLI